MDKIITSKSGDYTNEEIFNFIKDISIDYGILFNKNTVEEVKNSNSRKKTLGLLLRQFGLYNYFLNRKITIKYHKNKTAKDEGKTAYMVSKPKTQYDINLIGYNGDEFKNSIEKNTFIIGVAHELSHIRFYEDDYKYKFHELAVDILYLTLGHTETVVLFYKEIEYHKSLISYIDIPDLV